MPVKNFYTANEVKPGDVFIVAIKAMVQHDGSYRLYRCPMPPTELDGDRLYGERAYTEVSWDEDVNPVTALQITAETIFPILRNAKGPDNG